MDRRGLSILELVVVLAVLAVLLGIGAAAIPRDRFELNQTREAFERDLARARFNAISANATIDLSLLAGGAGYQAAVRSAPVSRWGYVVRRADVFPNVAISATVEGASAGSTAEAGVWSFDARGVGFSQADDPNALMRVTFTHARTGRTIVILVNRYGRVV